VGVRPGLISDSPGRRGSEDLAGSGRRTASALAIVGPTMAPRDGPTGDPCPGRRPGVGDYVTVPWPVTAGSSGGPEESAPEPANSTSRSPLLLFFEELRGGSGEFGDRGVVAEEVDVDATDEFVS
jgi:hypothetical protein